MTDMSMCDKCFNSLIRTIFYCYDNKYTLWSFLNSCLILKHFEIAALVWLISISDAVLDRAVQDWALWQAKQPMPAHPHIITTPDYYQHLSGSFCFFSLNYVPQFEDLGCLSNKRWNPKMSSCSLGLAVCIAVPISPHLQPLLTPPRPCSSLHLSRPAVLQPPTKCPRTCLSSLTCALLFLILNHPCFPTHPHTYSQFPFFFYQPFFPHKSFFSSTILASSCFCHPISLLQCIKHFLCVPLCICIQVPLSWAAYIVTFKNCEKHFLLFPNICIDWTSDWK